MNTERETTYDVYICYRRASDYYFVQDIRDHLEKRGIRCFPDPSELSARRYDSRILTAIRNTPAFLLILSPGTLDRCIDGEDRVRRKIIAAVDGQKTIIPVMHDGFTWPLRWDKRIPQQIRSLEQMNGVSGSTKRSNEIIDHIVRLLPETAPNTHPAQQSPGLPTDTAGFFAVALREIPAPVSVDMAFHAGAEWRRTSDKLEILTNLLREGIPLRILLNSAQTISWIAREMQQPLRRYVSFEQCLADWLELAKAYPRQIEVRICPFPLLHRIYLIRGNEDGYVNVKYYTYGNSVPEDDYRQNFSSSPQYALYEREFQYLWDRSERAGGRQSPSDSRRRR